MARLVMSQWMERHEREDNGLTGFLWDEDSRVEPKNSRRLKPQANGLLKCSQCGTDVKIHVSPKRNPHSGKLGRVVNLKDHDLCRRCWRQIIRHARESFPTTSSPWAELEERREVA